MDEAQRANVDEVIRFRDDMRSFQRMLQEPKRPSEFEEFRQTLLQRQGVIQPILERVLGRILKPRPFYQGQPINIWELALYDVPTYNQAYYTGQVADRLTTLIGMLEADVSLLDPPAPQPEAPPTVANAGQTINVHGGTVNIAQAHSGNIAQQISHSQDVAEITSLLRNL